MKTTIVIANNLLKIGSPASQIEQDLLDELCNKGIKVIAFCSSLGNLTKPSDKYETIIIRERKIWRYIFGIIGLFFPDILNMPDYHLWTCGKRMEKTIRNYLKSSKVDYIHSFSFECSCHIVAYNIHKDYMIPWIATFFDSWSDEPSRKFVTSYFRKSDQQMEKLIANNATVIVHNNTGISNVWARRYGEEISNKMVVIPLNINFNRLSKSQLETDNKERLTVSHIGTFYKHRDASVFINAVQLFCEKYPKLRERLQICFIGTVMGSDIENIKRSGLSDMFKILGRLPVEKCEKYYMSSDVFLSTAGLEFERITFPSKIIKYLFYGKPILGITPSDTVLCTELRNAGHSCFVPGDVNGIADFFYKAITDYQSICNFDTDYWRRFSVEKVGVQYLNIIQQLR